METALEDVPNLAPSFDEISDTTLDREKSVKMCRESLNFLAAVLMPLIFTILFPKLHETVWQILKDAVARNELPNPAPKDKFPQIAIGWPRGHAKTTLIKLFIVFCILFTRKQYILVVAANLAKAQNILADVCSMLKETNVRVLFGDYTLGLVTDRVDLKVFSFMGRNIIMGAIGAGGDPRGLNIQHMRPDIIMMDDVQSKENAESPLQAKNLLNWMTATLFKTKSPHGCIFIYIGNKFSANGTILKILQKNPNWVSVIIAGLLLDGTALWPEFRSREDLLEEFRNDIAMGTPEAFIAEIMNDDTSSITSIFDISKVPPCPISEDALVVGSYIIIDVAGSRPDSDDTTIMRYNFYGEASVLEEIDAEKYTPGDTIRKALTMALTNNVPLIGVESVAYQSSLLYWFDQICKQMGIEGINFVELKPMGVPKTSRILTMFRTLIGTQVEGVPMRPTLFLREKVKPAFFWEITQFKPDKKNNVDNILDNAAYSEQVVLMHGNLILSDVPTADREAFDNAKVWAHNTSF